MRVIVLIAGLLVFANNAAAEQPLTTNKMWALAPGQADRRAESDLLSVLTPAHGFKKGMLRMVRGTTFTTAAHGSEYESLCRRDDLTLLYAWTTDKGGIEDRPMKPYGVETTASFADIGLADQPIEKHDVWSPACKALDQRHDVSWFTARDDRQAMEAVLLYRQARTEVRTGTLKPEPCPSVLKAACDNAILDMKQLTEVKDCAAPEGLVCYELWSFNTALTIVFKHGKDLAPGDIQSISVAQYVVVT